jgi:hypothetical protein
MRRRGPIAAPCGLVQVIHVGWDKSARGGAGARRRNAVPRARAVAEDGLLDIGGRLYAEEWHWRSENGFADPVHSRQQCLSPDEGYRFGCVSVSAGLGGLRVHFQYDGTRGGAPNRWFINSPAEGAAVGGRELAVGAGQWVQVCYNGRFSDDGGWWYEQTTVNVAWFVGEPSGRVFLDSEPTRELCLLADLW